MTRRAARVDRNHAAIRDALRRAGVLVRDCSRYGQGFPDLMCLHRITQGVRFLEVKDGSKPPSARKLTFDEVQFAAEGWPVHVVTTVVEALEACGVKVAP